VTIDYPELADFLLVAEAVLQTPAKKIAEEANLHLADSALHAPAAQFAGQDFYPAFATKAAVLCAHLIKNHPLKDGNVQVALVATIEFCGRNDFIWSLPPDDEDGMVTASVLTDLAAAELNDTTIENLARWIADRIDESPPEPPPGRGPRL
jgi:prophage maintenance system killer protein